MQVGLHGVVALLLKFVGSNLVHQTYSAALLLQVHDNTLALLVYHLHSLMQLLSAITTLAGKDIACHAAGVHAHQYGFFGSPLALENGDVLQSVALLTEWNNAEVAIFRRQVGLYAFLHQAFLLQAVGYQVLDGNYLQAMLACHLLQLGHACHGSVLVENLDECRSRLKTAKASQVYGSLGVPCPLQHTTVLGIEWIDVSGTAKVGGFPCGVGQGTDSSGTVVRADTGSAPIQQIHGDGERSAQHAGVGLYLAFQFQFLGTAHGDGGTEYTASILQHEVHLIFSNQFRRSDEVAFILTVFVVYDNHELAFFEVCQSIFNAAKLDFLVHIFVCLSFL